jgi:hypothetical protein
MLNKETVVGQATKISNEVTFNFLSFHQLMYYSIFTVVRCKTPLRKIQIQYVFDNQQLLFKK